MSRNRDIRPWLGYFTMLRRYEHDGFLQTEAAKHEAYVTQPALYAMTPGDDPAQQAVSGAVSATLRHIRTYCACQQANAIGLSSYDHKKAIDPAEPLPDVPVKALLLYEREPFALHVVKPSAPHDLMYTLCIIRLRRWFWPFTKIEYVQVINY